MIKKMSFTYQDTDEACTFTVQDSDIVLPFFTCTSSDPIILARAAVTIKDYKSVQMHQANN